MEPRHAGEVIRSRREALGLARIDVQRLARVSEATIARAERGGVVSRRTAERLAPVLGVSPDDLRPVRLDDEDER